MIEQVWADAPLWVVWMMQFFAIEMKALMNSTKGDTLTEVVRYIFGFSTRAGKQSTGMRWRRGSFYALSAVIILHFNGVLM